ncbi:hypothetical protein [Chryseobacterium oranimense]|uniref:hypothetical protein n=1 Tax=Chryseobacterium oranimense TaxID=421058 RepID=UPI0022364198|nr:hypothetical protein [Chryseobacterium oranimense]
MNTQSHDTVIIDFDCIECIKSDISAELVFYWNDMEGRTLLENIFNNYYKCIPVVGDKLNFSFQYEGYRSIVEDFNTHLFLVTGRTLLLDNESPEPEQESYANSINATWIIKVKPII